MDPTRGHEQQGKRPFVVLSHLPQFGLVIGIPLTTRDKGWWTQVPISGGEGNLSEDSFALCHHIRSLSVERVEQFIGHLGPMTLGKIRTVVSRLLAL